MHKKPLDESAIQIIEADFKTGKDLIQSFRALRKLGYTEPTGRPLDYSNLSKYACQHGYRRRNGNRGTRLTNQLKKVTQPATTIFDKVINSTVLTREQKLKFVEIFA